MVGRSSSMALSLTSWSLPACTLEEVVGIARALGIGALDVGLFYRSALNRDEILNDPAAAAHRLLELGIPIANYYHLFGRDLSERNLASPGTIDENVKDMDKVMTFADMAGINSVFILPGIVNRGQSRARAMEVSIDSIRHLCDVQKAYKAKLCIEPHVHSWAENITLVRQLVDRTGVGLVLDYSHFICLGYRQEEIDLLAPYAVHVHLRQARMGVLQEKMSYGTINFPALFGHLQDCGYQGWTAIEYVHQDYMNTLSEDVITETVAMRDCFYSWHKVL